MTWSISFDVKDGEIDDVRIGGDPPDGTVNVNGHSGPDGSGSLSVNAAGMSAGASRWAQQVQEAAS